MTDPTAATAVAGTAEKDNDDNGATNNNSNNDESWVEAEFLSLGQDGDDDDEDQGDNNNNDNDASDDDDDDDDLFGDKERLRQQQQQRLLLPPWMDRPTDYRRVNYLTALHNEIVSFCNLMQPLPDEMSQRQALVNRIQQLAYRTFGQQQGSKCRVEVFGSQATGMCLPTSDIDLVIILNDGKSKESDTNEQEKKQASNTTTTTDGGDGNANKDSTGGVDRQQQRLVDEREMANYMTNIVTQQEDQSPLQRLAEAIETEFQEQDELTYLEVIENTTVPLVKFTHGPSNVSVDICFDREEGVRAATLMRTFLNAMPPLRPLTFVLKYFLAARAINEPYTGGVGSYMLQLMIVSFLQARERATVQQHHGHSNLYNLGCLLVEFLELYGMDFNYITTGISVRHDGYYFPKGDKNRKDHFWQPLRPFNIAMENPLEPTLDVGKPSFRIQTVQRAFEVAFRILLTHVANPAVPTESILASILPPTDEMRKRAAAAAAAASASATAAAAASSNANISNNRATSPRRDDSRGRRTAARSSSFRSNRSSDMDTDSEDEADARDRRRKRHRRR